MLGICVVYLVKEEDGAEGYRLLDLSLRQIERVTEGPYRIYGNCPNGDAETLKRLHARGVTLVEVAERHERASRDHSNRLNRLVDKAVLDGCRHVAVLDMDSWPLWAGWDWRYGDLLTAEVPLAAMVRSELGDNFPFPAFLLMQADFWVPQASSFSTLLRRRTAPQTMAHCSRPEETGSGIFASLLAGGQSFYRLERSNRWEVHSLIAGLYDNTLFHLGAGSRSPRFISDDWQFELNGSGIRRAFADRMNGEIRAFALSKLIERHDRFVSELADGDLTPMLPILTDPAALPKTLERAAVADRWPWEAA